MRIWLAILILTLAAVAGGCGKAAKAPTDFTATVAVTGDTATVTVDVPGMKQNQDYHVHLKLDGGPEVMAYSHPYTLRDLAPGEHRLHVAISNPAHQNLPGLEKTLAFTVNPPS